MNKPLAFTLFLSFTTLPVMLKFFLRTYYKKHQKKLTNLEENCYFDCFFINYKNFECRNHLIANEACGDECSHFYLQRLIRFVGSAQKTINMCMYMHTCKQMSEELASARRRGVKVQIILDKLMANTTPSIKNQKRERASGVEHRKQKSSDSMMHHKFCLIDEGDPQLAKMFFGSLNVTTQALSKNFEAVVFTNNQSIIQRFSEEFGELWREFE